MILKERHATDDEIREYFKFQIEHGRKVKYRHWGYERGCRTSKSGVQFREYGNAKLSDDLKVMRHGRKEKVIATHWTMADGSTHIYDLRLEGIHFPPRSRS